MPLFQLWHQTLARSGAILVVPATLPYTPRHLDGTDS